ncbi:acyl-CoA dehydrogenase family protein [Paraburkholderia sp. J67]|uniref:acyl-CoA dehydrogenase family protein n=1 Tax=Paraburkholderia sp. J67 TaxID=2805435 RepID=UPI002ABE8D24|nr:acyl-CoA dehydrogenase family protein [Paraburkholderia sp. J67]
MSTVLEYDTAHASPDQQRSQATPLLTEALLERVGARAANYDRDNAFFAEDLEELKAAGFLRASVPRELGGLGLTLPQLVREQIRLAYRAPATALALNMHLYWAGAALYLWRRGDRSAEWILREIGVGRVFAAGHGEPGNDAGLADSTVKATPLPGGAWRFDGHKILTSLAPAWDWLGIHGRDDSDPANPRIVHAFIRRSAEGHRTDQTWDALGLRATRSDDTWLEGVIAQPEHVTRILPAGPPDDPFVDGILGAVLPGLGAVYYGIAKRAFDLALEAAGSRRSLALGGRTHAFKPLTQAHVAQAAIELESIEALLERTAQRWWQGYAPGEPWLAQLLATKQHAVDGALRVVNLALQVGGAASLSRRNELERLFRDVRAGAFHPPNSDATLELIGQSWLGVLGAV